MKKTKLLIILVSLFLMVLTITSCGKKTFVVSFDGANGTESVSLSVNDGQSVDEPAAPTRDGYDFLGWYNGDEPYDFSSAVTSDLILTAG